MSLISCDFGKVRMPEKLMIPAQLERRLGQPAGGAEAVQKEVEPPFPVPFLLENQRDIVVGVARMDA